MRALPHLHLPSAGAGALAFGFLLGALDRVGPSPQHAVGLGLALGLALGVAPWLPALPRSARWTPLVVLAAADWLLAGVGAASGQSGLNTVRLALALAAMAVYALALRGLPGGRAASWALGAVAALLLPPLAAVGLGGIALMLPAPAEAPGAAAARPGWTEGAARAAGVVLAAGGATALVLGARIGLGPTTQSLVIPAVAALLGAALAPATRSGSAALVLGGLALGAAWAGLGLAPDLSAVLYVPARAWGGTALLLSPLALVGLLGGAATSGAWGPLPLRVGAPAAGLGLALGLSLISSAGSTAPLLAIAASGAVLIGGSTRRAQVLALLASGLLIAAALGAPAPAVERLIAGGYSHLQDDDGLNLDRSVRAAQQEGRASLLRGVAGSVRAPAAVWATANEGASTRDSARVQDVDVEIEGLVAEARSRAGDAEAMAGLLARLLAPDPGRLLILGDDAARTLRAIGNPAASAMVSVPSPDALRGLAALDAGVEAVGLRPGVLLRAAHPALLLSLSGQVDAVVEISRAPWADGARAALDEAHLATVARRLSPDGVYVLVLHTGRWPEGGPQGVVRALAERFEALQLWLPLAGADTLLVVAGHRPPPLDPFLQRATRLQDNLQALDLRSGLDLAGFAFADRGAALDWSAEGRVAVSTRGLGTAVFSRRVPHLASLASHTVSPGDLWDLSGPEASRSVGALQQRIRARQVFLELVGDAAEGRLEQVFQQAQTLLSETGEAGVAALDPLLQPHLSRARQELARATKEGLGSTGWESARAAAVTAQMLNPSSPAPRVMLGDIALAQGNLQTAEQEYSAARDANRESASAWTGLARVYRMKGDAGRAEEALREATRAAPDLASAWLNLGVYYVEQGRPRDAEAALRRAASLDLEGDSPHLALARLALDEGEPARALIEAERALRIAPSGLAWYLRGRAHFDLEQYPRAEEDFRNAVLAEPKMAEARGGIGLIQAIRGDLPGAINSFKAVLALDPNNAGARENLRRVLELQARVDPAAAAAGASPAPPAPAAPGSPGP